MQTNEKIIEKIKSDKELLSTFSRNNKKNAGIYLSELEIRISKYSVFKDKVAEVLEERRNKIKAIESDHRILIIEKQIEDLKYKVTYLNTINSSYEKTGLDRVVYDISKYYKGNFAKVSNDLLRAVEIFERVGITITGKDFIYDKLAEEYMNVFLSQRGNLGSDILHE